MNIVLFFVLAILVCCMIKKSNDENYINVGHYTASGKFDPDSITQVLYDPYYHPYSYNDYYDYNNYYNYY